MSGEAERRAVLVAIILSLIGVAFFSIMDVAMKALALAIGAYSAVFWRNVAATLMSGVGMIAQRPPRPSAQVMRLHIMRAALIGPMSVLFFWALTRLPLAEAIAIAFIAPVIALYLSALMLKEQISRYSIIAAVLGMAGLAIILSGRFSGDYDEGALLGAVAVLISAILFALNLILQRQQAQLASAIEISFYQNLLVLATLLPFAPWFLSRAGYEHWLLILLAAGLVASSQMLLAKAYARAPASRLIPIEYSAFIWAALFGWLVFDERLTLTVIAGVVFIIAACFITAREKPRLAAHVEADTA